jgi:hypothetical protein
MPPLSATTGLTHGKPDYDAPEDIAADLITDLMHMVNAHGSDPLDKLRIATINYKPNRQRGNNMQEFTATVGVYVRAYAAYSFGAKSVKAAQAEAIAKFLQDDGDITFYETDWTNMSAPAIVSLERVQDRKIVIEGHDFAMNEDDARDLHAQELLNIVKLVAAGDTDADKLKERAAAVLAEVEAVLAEMEDAHP